MPDSEPTLPPLEPREPMAAFTDKIIITGASPQFTVSWTNTEHLSRPAGVPSDGRLREHAGSGLSDVGISSNSVPIVCSQNLCSSSV